MVTKFDDLKGLKPVEKISDEVWVPVYTWDSFSKQAIGRQLVRAIASVGANISESFGRDHFGEKIHTLCYARDSIFETKYWLNRSLARNLINYETATSLAGSLSQSARHIPAFVNSLKA